MSQARKDFYEALASFTHSLESPDVISKDLTEVKHNQRARLLRNGLSVTSFAMVEEFVKQRTGEVLLRIGSSATPFGELPEGLQLAAIEGVIQAMTLQSKFVEKDNLFSFYQTHSKSVGSTGTSPYYISPIALCNNYINLSSKEIEKILDSFRVESSWTTLTSIINRLSVGIIVPKQSFDDAAARRHSSAHVANTNTQYSSLEAYRKEAIAFCLAYDLIISKALRLINARDGDYLIRKVKISSRSISIRYLKQGNDNKWKEQKAKEGDPRQYRTVKSDSDYSQLQMDCLRRGRLEGFAVVHTTQSGVPIEWFTPDID